MYLLCFHRGGNPFSTVRLRPTVTNDRSAPVIWSTLIPTHPTKKKLLTLLGRSALHRLVCPAGSPGLDGEKKNAIWMWDSPFTAANRHLEYFGTVLLTEQMFIYLRYLYFPSLFLSLCLWWWYLKTTFLPALEKRMSKNGQRKYCDVFKLLFVVEMTVRNLFCCHRTVKECTVEDLCISPPGPYDKVESQCWCRRDVGCWELTANFKKMHQKGTHKWPLSPRLSCVYICTSDALNIDLCHLVEQS